jgi:hypothetical protein
VIAKGNFHSAGVRLTAYLVRIDLRQPPRRETSRAPTTTDVIGSAIYKHH